jgi:methyltransferase (TIGR00027 family)
MSESTIQHVSDTAFLVAHCRAAESARPDALFHDPLAARLAGEKGRAIAESFPTAAMTEWSVAIRTVIIDEFIRGAIARGVGTVLSLGAGLDTRPYRLELPRELTWIEVDYPDVIELKEERLEGETPRCHLERVGLDLADVTARRALFARIDSLPGRVLVLTEGFIPYLEVEQVAALADDLRALPRVDSWVVDYLSPESHAYREQAGLDRRMQQAQFKFKPADWFAFFAAHGWRTREIRYLPEEGVRVGRRAPLPRRIRLITSLLRWITPAEKRAGFEKFAGYVMLEPAEASPAP